MQHHRIVETLQKEIVGGNNMGNLGYGVYPTHPGPSLLLLRNFFVKKNVCCLVIVQFELEPKPGDFTLGKLALTAYFSEPRRTADPQRCAQLID